MVDRGDFGTRWWLRAVTRRRLGLALFRLTHPRVQLGTLCDVRHPLHFLVQRGAVVRFGPRCVLDQGLVVECRGTLTVGDRTVFGHHVTLAVNDEVAIGRDCLIAEFVSIRDHDHQFDVIDVPIIEQGRRVAPIHIGDNVWLGAKVTVTSGVTIGDNTIVGANAVVTSDLPAGSIAVGVPARVVKKRS